MFPKSLTLFLSRGDIVPKARQVFLIFQLQLSRVPEGDLPIYGRSGVFDPVDLSKIWTQWTLAWTKYVVGLEAARPSRSSRT